MIHLFAHKVYREAIERIAQDVPRRIMLEHAEDLHRVWATLHGKPMLTEPAKRKRMR